MTLLCLARLLIGVFVENFPEHVSVQFLKALVFCSYIEVVFVDLVFVHGIYDDYAYVTCLCYRTNYYLSHAGS